MTDDWIRWVFGAAIAALSGAIKMIWTKVNRIEDRVSSQDTRAQDALNAHKVHNSEEHARVWGAIDKVKEALHNEVKNVATKTDLVEMERRIMDAVKYRNGNGAD